MSYCPFDVDWTKHLRGALETSCLAAQPVLQETIRCRPDSSAERTERPAAATNA